MHKTKKKKLHRVSFRFDNEKMKNYFSLESIHFQLGGPRHDLLNRERKAIVDHDLIVTKKKCSVFLVF